KGITLAEKPRHRMGEELDVPQKNQKKQANKSVGSQQPELLLPGQMTHQDEDKYPDLVNQRKRIHRLDPGSSRPFHPRPRRMPHHGLISEVSGPRPVLAIFE